MAAFVLRQQLKTSGNFGFVLCRPSTVCRHAGSSTTPSGKDFPVIQSNTSTVQRGTGGRSSFSGKIATIFGGTGFLGRSVCNQLGKTGTQLNIAHRGDTYVIRRLKLCGDLGQVHFQHYYLNDEESIYKAIKHSNVVVNLIGRNHDTANYTLEDAHVKGPRAIARIARECGVQTLVHVSALNACEKPKPIILKKGSTFLATKWRGENAVREEFPDAIIFRPADMFGDNDQFCCYYGGWLRHTVRAMSLWKSGKETIKQPVYVNDVGKAIARAIYNPHAAGQTFQAVGPNRYLLSDLMDWFHNVMQRKPTSGYIRFDLRLDPVFWAKLLYSEFWFKRHKVLSWEKTEREYVTDIVDPKLPTLEDLGIELTNLENRIFHELKRFRSHRYKDTMMKEYIRPVEPPPLMKD